MANEYKYESLGRSAYRAVKADLKLADYVQFLTYDGNLGVWPKEHSKLGSTAQAVAFQFRLPGLGQAVYGMRAGGVTELLSYSVDSSD